MSNALAIAAVTAVLKDLLDNAMIDESVVNAAGPVKVTTLAPDRIKTGEAEAAQLNLFLYHVTPNAGWRNVGLPSRNGQGERLTNPPLALDLYYLLTAYGQNDFETEILLGYAMQRLHETPVLTRAAIRTALIPSPLNIGILPPAFEALSAADLADQVEQIKLTPQQMTTEEVWKLWSALQAHYRPTVAYHVSVVLIEAAYPGRSPLPVLTRGRPDPATGRDQGVIVQPHLVPPFPTLQVALPPNQQLAVRLGEKLTLRGHHLDGDTVMARFTQTHTGESLELPVEPGATPTQFQVQIPQAPDDWQAGVYRVSGVIKLTPQPDRTTNELPVVLAPQIISIGGVGSPGEITLTVQCSPNVRKTQRVTLLISDREIVAEPIAANQTDTLIFKAKGLPSGTQWVRLRVDGAESILIDRSGPLPVFDPTQKVTI